MALYYEGHDRANGDDDSVPCENVCCSACQVDANKGAIGY